MKLMKRIIPLSLLICALSLLKCGNNFEKGSMAGDKGNVRIAFNEYEHNFGKVAEGEKVAHVFKFENTGMQTKTITVKSNADPPVVLLRITAEVVTGNQ
jgi:hypothetical protein